MISVYKTVSIKQSSNHFTMSKRKSAEPILHDLATYNFKRRRSNRSIPILQTSQALVVEQLSRRRGQGSRAIGQIHTAEHSTRRDGRIAKLKRNTDINHVSRSPSSLRFPFNLGAPNDSLGEDVFAGVVFEQNLPPRRERKV